MVLTIEEAAQRYNVSQSTIRAKHALIANKKGFTHRSTGGSDRNLYKSSVLDRLAKSGDLGSAAKLAIANRKHQ